MPNQIPNFWLTNTSGGVRQRFIIVLLYFLLTTISCFSQQIDIAVQNTPLNQILIGLRDKYKLQFSFDDRLLSKFNLTVNHQWTLPEDAIQSLISDLPLFCRKQGDIYLILPKRRQVMPRNYLLFGCCSRSQNK